MDTGTSTIDRIASPPSRRSAAIAAALLVGLVGLPAATAGTDWPPPAAELSDADVRQAIAAIQDGLRDQRDPERGWDPARWTSSWGSRSQVGGYSALACLALVRTGASPHAEGLAEAITQVRLAELEGIYALATRASLLAELPPTLRTGLEADVQRLVSSLHLETGGWNYRIGETRARRDNSLRQFGAMALWDAAAAGVAIPPEAWAIIDGAFIEAQRPDGGWNYTQNDEPSRGSMTAAAVATLMITDEQVPATRRPATGPADARRAAIDRGIRWLDRRFRTDENPGSGAWFFYYAYSIERVGLAAGIVRLAGRDWFRELARESIDRTCRRTDDDRIVLRRDRRTRVDDLAFTLLLLSRGRVPLLAGKLVLPEAATDERPRDMGRLARIAGDAMETDVGWRRVDVSDPLEDWLSVPVLGLVGHGPLPDRTTAAGAAFHAKLGPFLDAGGWLMVVDEGDGRFGRDVSEAIEAVRPRATVDRAERDHPVFVFHRDSGRREPVRIVRDGVRDLAVLLRGDRWLAPPTAADRRRAGDTRRVDPHEATLLNLALAATADVPPGPRLAARPGDPRAAGRAVLGAQVDRDSGPAAPISLTLRRLRHAGHWDAVPGAEAAFAAWAESTGVATVGIGAPLTPGEPPPPADGPSLILLTGTEAPSPAAARELAAAVRRATEAGHRVLVVGCGRAGDAFSRPVERALGDAGASAPRRPPAAAILLASPLPLSEVRWTSALAADLGPRPTAPRLRATRFGPDAAEVLLSHEDVLLGLLGRGTWDVRGHTPDSARRLVLAAAWPTGRMPGGDAAAAAPVAAPR
ncbi:MAG: hypothetical protein ACYTEV_01685 [Planctomycetota bacterium]|jgi:hypothetical protein